MSLYISINDGLSCKKVNPFYAKSEECHNESGSEYIDRREKYMLFESTNPILPLTEHVPVGEKFDGEEVWQYRAGDNIDWLNSNVQFEGRTFLEYQEDNNDKQTRIAIAPSKHPSLDEMVAHTMGRMPSLDGLDTPSKVTKTVGEGDSVLEALQMAKKELESFVPVTDVEVLRKVTAAINKLTPPRL